MVRGCDVYLQCLKQAIRHPAVSLAFANGAFQHRQLEQDFNECLGNVCPERERISFPHMEMPAAQYWQRNFFSILFLTIFDTIGISKKRQHLYGMILHAIRGIVTATDNILDSESKGSVQLSLRGGRVLPNMLLVLMETGLLHQLLYELSGDANTASETWTKLFGELFCLGSEETAEENDIETVLEPKTLLEEIHQFRGAGLLSLAFVAPAANEPELAEELGAAKAAVGRIGLALQILDDITDFKEDLVARNHNMLRSWVVHRQPDGPCDDQVLREMAPEVLDSPEVHFPMATRQVMHVAIEIALAGFDMLHELGHPVTREAAFELIETMFTLRGLKRLWSVYTDYVKSEERSSVDCSSYFPAT